MTSKLFVFFLFISSLSACSFEASIQSLESQDENTTESRKEADFIHGEIITTDNGFQVKGIFGDFSEKKTLSNGYQIEGVFYQ